MSDPLPFSPLTHEELRARRNDALRDAAYRVETIVEGWDGVFEDYDLDRLRECGRRSLDHLVALRARGYQA